MNKEINMELYKEQWDFINDNSSEVLLLMGCIGSAKTVTCLIKIWSSLHGQQPCYDGIKRARWAIVRQTLQELKKSTMKSWDEWFNFGNIKGDPPVFYFKGKDKELEVHFFGISNEKDMSKIRSTEFTGIYFNELQFLQNVHMLMEMKGRTGRYPSVKQGGGLGRTFIIADCNPPSTNHWIYQYFEVKKPLNWRIIKTPAALISGDPKVYLPRQEYAIDARGERWINNPDAPFLKNIKDPRYWLSRAESEKPSIINVDLCSKYGTVSYGSPVHQAFNEIFHYSQSELKANPSLPIVLGFDFGNTPACAVIQRQDDGTIYVLDEFPTEKDFLRPFISDVVIPKLDSKYPFWRKNHSSRHDPSGLGAIPDAKSSAVNILKDFGIDSFPCKSNNMDYRRDALNYYLTKMIGGHPAIILNVNCYVLREALNGEFQYSILPESRSDQTPTLKPVPRKNFHSHISEALEYACSFFRENVPSMSKKEESRESFKNMLLQTKPRRFN